MGDTRLVCVNPARVSELWPYARHLIKAAIDRTRLSSFEDVERAILAGQYLLWLAWSGAHVEAAAATQLVRPVCVLVACSGQKRERWLSLLGQIETYAKNEGCKAMRIYGRKGWTKVLDGYRVEHVILEKTL